MDNLYKKDMSSSNSEGQQQIVKRLFILEQHRQSPYWLVFLLIVAVGLLVAYILSLRIGVFSGFDSARSYHQNNWRNRPEVYRKVELLKGKMDTLVTGSMEHKIDKLEKNLSSGIIRPSDLETIQELKTDLQILKTYSEQNSLSSLAMVDQQSTGKTPINATSAVLYSDKLLQEISSLKSLFYLSIASCGFLVVVVSGVWLYGNTRLKQLQGSMFYRQALLDKPNSDRY